MFSQTPAGASLLPDHRGFQSSLPNPASHVGPSASPRTLAPAAFPAGGAAGTKGRHRHRRNEVHPDKAHKTGRLSGGGGNVKFAASFHKGHPSG